MDETVETKRREGRTALYANVPEDQREGLERFRQAHPIRRVSSDRTEWEYRVAGDGADALLWLPGALLKSDSIWPQATYFSDRFRVVIPSYPPIPTMDGLIDGLARLLDAEGIETADVVGGSFGGMVAQVLVRQYPHRVRRLVLSHTFPPDPRRGMKASVAAPLFSLMPESAVMSMYWRRMADLIPFDEPAAAWLEPYLIELTGDRLEKQDVVALYRRAGDYDGQQFEPDDLESWPGSILLVMADDDPATPRSVRDAMVELYPRADVQVLSGTGHAAALLRPREYFALLESFLVGMHGPDGA